MKCVNGIASAQVRAPPDMADSGKPTPLKANAGAEKNPAPDSAVRSERVSAAMNAPMAIDTATSASRPSATQATLPGGCQPRPQVVPSSASTPMPPRLSHGHSSLPARAAAVWARPGCAPSHSPRVRSRSSRPTLQAPAVMARMWSSAGISAAAKNCS